MTTSALVAALIVAGVAWAWSASTVNTAQVTAAALATPGSPSATRTGGTGDTCTAINVTWSSVTGATSYRVERNVSGTWVELAASHVTTSYGDSGSWTNLDIDYRITPKSGNWIAPTPAVTSIACGFGEVDDLTFTFASSCIATQMNWTTPLGTVTGYDVEYRMNGGAWTAVPGGTNVGATSFNDTSVYTTYPHGDLEYRVLARNGATIGSVSNVVAPTTDYGCLATPTNVAALGCLINSKVVSWTAPASPVNGYTIQRQVNGGGWSAAATDLPPSTSWTDTASHPLTNVVDYRIYSENDTLVDDIPSSTATTYSGFYVREVEFVPVGASNTTLEANERLIVRFSQPTNASFSPSGILRGGANGAGTRGLWIASTAASASSIGRLQTSGNGQFTANQTATGTWQPNANKDVWTWTFGSTTGLTMSAATSVTGFTLPDSTPVLCSDNSTALSANTPTVTGRW